MTYNTFCYSVSFSYFCDKILIVTIMADIREEYLTCPIRQVLSRFGDKWSLLVLFMLNKSESGVLRFNEMNRMMSDCSQKMLSQTLRNLEHYNLVHREVYPQVPPKVEYSLTEIGKRFHPVIAAMETFGNEYIAQMDGGKNE